MKKLILALSIVSLLVSCDNGGMKTIENPVTITFDTDGGTDIAPKTVEAFSTIKLPTPKKDGYEFVGWYVIEGGQKGLVSGDSYQVDRDITFYARFVIWYPFEVSNITSTVEEWEVNNIAYLVTISWDNPTDDNFSHVAFASKEIDFDARNFEPGIKSIAEIVLKNVFEANRVIYIKCADKNGNESKGIRYVYR